MSGSGIGTTSVGATTDQDINGLLSGVRWITTTFTFSFPTLASQYGTYSTGETTTFQPVNTQMANEARWVLSSAPGAATYGNVSLLNLTENTISPGAATIRIGMSDSAQPTAYAYYPSTAVQGGDVWMGTQIGLNAMTNPVRGNYAWHAMMHELGHALGLKHGQETGGPANTAMTAAHDAMEYSIMTYRSYVGGPITGYTNEQWGYAQSLMMYDIAAIQDMYGARFDPTPHTYRFSPTTGEMFVDGVGQGAPGANRIFLTIWDGSGAGAYDFSLYTTSLTIDLRPGGYSILSPVQLAYLGNGNYAHGNVYNALQYHNDFRSLIRTVYGGSNNDSIIGNQTNNFFYGGGGNDTIDGGAGRDVAYFNVAYSAATIVHNANGSWTITTPGEVETLTNLEIAQFSDRSIVLRETARRDFNCDGISDLLWLNSSNGNVVEWDMNSGQVLSSGSLGGDSNWSVVGTGDFNGDGQCDLLWRNSSNGNVVEWDMNDRTAISSGFIGGDSNWSVVGTGDFNGDGQCDLLWRNSSNGNVVEWDMNDRTAISSGFIGGNLNWGVVGTGDFNGDGMADILWRNSVNGNVVEWDMNDRTVIASNILGGDLNWKPVAV